MRYYPLFHCQVLDSPFSHVLCRQKKLKRNAKVSSQANDRDDIFIFRGAPAISKAAKPARKYRQMPSPIPVMAVAPAPAPASAPASAVHQPLSPQPFAAARTVQELDDDDDEDDETAEAERMRTLEQQMQAILMAKAMQESAAASKITQTGNASNTIKKPVDRFTHQFDRKLLGDGDSEGERIQTLKV